MKRIEFLGKKTERKDSSSLMDFINGSEHQLLYPETFKKNYYDLYLKLLIYCN